MSVVTAQWSSSGGFNQTCCFECLILSDVGSEARSELVLKCSDRACASAGLEEMVHTDPVSAQVGFLSSIASQSLGEKKMFLQKDPICNVSHLILSTVIYTLATLPSFTATWPATPSSFNTMGSLRSDQVRCISQYRNTIKMKRSLSRSWEVILQRSWTLWSLQTSHFSQNESLSSHPARVQ